MMKSLAELAELKVELLMARENNSHASNTHQKYVSVSLEEADRFIAIVEGMEYLCMVQFPCEERHCPERGVDYVVHNKTCPYSDEWEGP